MKTPLLNPMVEYGFDATQRGLLLLDILRQRANNMIEHERQGMPPLLDFSYETVLDAREFEHPANYALLKITEVGDVCLEDCLDPYKPPVLIVDPRAGHGPGIGGFKRDSEVGIALEEGHPVYFAVFYPDPEPHQDIGDVLGALRRFVEEVSSRHDDTPPVLYGNCQAGWMITLLSADCQGLVGPAVLNGSPLSYWAGKNQENPMQRLGGLTGGVWLTRFLADLGGGEFDGAWLVQNFETLNPAETGWNKYDRVFKNPEEEEERCLEFERWWNGFYRFSEEEITSVVEDLFIGDKLEQGEIELCPGCTVNLKNIENPLLIFASEGDEITPPRQALHWIRRIYPDTQALKEAGQRIVYLINPHVGHLGIFVSSSVVRKEHRAILEQVDELESLDPGLHEMIIDEPTREENPRHDQFVVRFEERRVEELCDSQSTEPFRRVRRLSKVNDKLYRTFVRPWVRGMTRWVPDRMIREAHPMRLSRKVFSERWNPWMSGVRITADAVRSRRDEEAPQEDNPLFELEREGSNLVAQNLDLYREGLDRWSQWMFTSLYGGGSEDE